MSVPSSSIRPFTCRPVDKIVQAVEATQQRRFSATGWTDEGRDGIRTNSQGDVKERLPLAVEEIKIANPNLRVQFRLREHVRLSRQVA